MDLPYAGEEVSMTILLPDQGNFRDFEEAMDAALVSRIIEEIQLTTVDLTMPKFEFESQFGLNDTLETMGMPNAFSELKADFSGMDGQSCLAGGGCLANHGCLPQGIRGCGPRGDRGCGSNSGDCWIHVRATVICHC